MANTYYTGSNIEFSAVFKDATTGAYVDPTTVTFRIKTPKVYGSIVTYVYLVDPELVRDSIGQYHADYVLDFPGNWFYQWEAAGNYIGAAEQRVCARNTMF